MSLSDYLASEHIDLIFEFEFFSLSVIAFLHPIGNLIGHYPR